MIQPEGRASLKDINQTKYGFIKLVNFTIILFKKRLKDNNIDLYLTHNEEKSVVTERFIRTLKTKIYKYMTSVSKNVYTNKLDDIVNEYNNTYHRTIEMKLMLKIVHILILKKKLMIKILSLKLLII